MASLRSDRTKADGTPYWSVLYRIGGRTGKQHSLSFEGQNGEADARYALELFNAHGPDRALELLNIERTERTTITVEQYLRRHIDNLTGVEHKTIDDYNRYLRRDIGPFLGSIQLTALNEGDLTRWVKHLETTGGRSKTGRAVKTIRNVYGFLSGALAKAVPEHIKTNPAAGRRLPKRQDQDDHEPVFLSRDEFAILLKAVTDPWKVLVEFLVASGCRWGEAVALKPRDIDLAKGTVRIRRAWKHSTTSGYYLGDPKTRRGKRTITVPKGVLMKLDLTSEWVFTNSGRGKGQFADGVTRADDGAVRYSNFWRNVWVPAVERSGLVEQPTPHDLRHTCASWMIAKGVPLPMISRHLGHEDITTTVNVYGHLDQTSAQAAADAIGEMLDSV